MAEPSARPGDHLPSDYPQFLDEVAARVAAARAQAVLAVSAAALAAYWEIGTGILERERREGWGAKVIKRLAADLRRVSRDEASVAAQSPLHARLRSRLAGRERARNVAAACCQIAVGAPHRPARQAQRTRCPILVCDLRRRTRLLTQGSRGADRERSARPPRRGVDDLRARAAAARLRACPRRAPGSVQLFEFL